MRISKLVQSKNIKLKFTLFPLHPYVPDEGMTLEELFKGRNFDLDAAQARLAELMAQEGLEFGHRTKTYNSRLAQELAKWIESETGNQEIHDRLYRAYFAKGQNLADHDVLVEIATSFGMSAEDTRTVLVERKYSDEVDEDWLSCRQRRIMAVPTYVCNGENLVGAQSYEALEQLVVRHGAVDY